MHRVRDSVEGVLPVCFDRSVTGQYRSLSTIGMKTNVSGKPSKQKLTGEVHYVEGPTSYPSHQPLWKRGG